LLFCFVFVFYVCCCSVLLPFFVTFEHISCLPTFTFSPSSRRQFCALTENRRFRKTSQLSSIPKLFFTNYKFSRPQKLKQSNNHRRKVPQMLYCKLLLSCFTSKLQTNVFFPVNSAFG
jgi:hypothetical protein